MSSKSRIVSTLRNTVLLSLLLGVTWITAAIQTGTVSLYITVILNASQGVYILIYSVLANNQVRGDVRERMSGVVSTYISSSQAKVSGGTWSMSHLGQTIKPLNNTNLTGTIGTFPPATLPLQISSCFCLNNSCEILFNALSWSSFSVLTVSSK